MSRLRGPDSATMIGLLTAAGVYLIYQSALPNMTDIRMAHPHDVDVEAQRKRAAYKGVALIGVVFLVARDVNSYLISGAALAGVDLMYKHANAVHPSSHKVEMVGSDTVAPSLDTAYPIPDYTEQYA